jgi:hypothetical protein
MHTLKKNKILLTGYIILCLNVYSYGALVLSVNLNDNTTNTTIKSTAGPHGIATSTTDTMYSDNGLAKLNGALSFNGTSDKIEFGNTLNDFTAKTVLLWIKPLCTNKLQYIYYDSYWQGPGFGDMILIREDGRMTISARTDSGESIASQTFHFPAGEWLQVGYTWDGERLHII